MRKTLHELVTGYAAATGCACEAEEGSCQAVLSVEGLGIHIGLAESSGMIVFQTGAALLPPAGGGREEFCMKLLAANNLFTDTMGFTLGVDESQELVTIQLAWDPFPSGCGGFRPHREQPACRGGGLDDPAGRMAAFRSRKRRGRGRERPRRNAFHEFPESLIRQGRTHHAYRIRPADVPAH